MRNLPDHLEGHITIQRHFDERGDKNNGWRFDLLEIYVDDERAGYASIQQIPSDRFEKWYPNGIWDYLRLDFESSVISY